MSRKVVRLTVDHLAQLEGPCRTCLFWQLDPVSRDRVDDEEAATEKEAWVSQVLRDWGSCGRVVLVDDQPVGYLIYAPEAFVPGAAGVPDRAGLTRRGAAHQRLGAPGARRRRARPDARPGHGPRPDQARRHQGGRGVRRHSRPGPAGQLRGARRTSWAASASRRSERTAPPRGCGWTSARRSPSRTRSRRRWSAWWEPCARPRRTRLRRAGLTAGPSCRSSWLDPVGGPRRRSLAHVDRSFRGQLLRRCSRRAR